MTAMTCRNDKGERAWVTRSVVYRTPLVIPDPFYLVTDIFMLWVGLPSAMIV